MFRLKLEWTGSPEHQRFVINDGDNHFWTGSGWSGHLLEARLYATHQDASRTLKVLADRHFRDTPVREFEVTAKGKVYADRPFSLEDMREYLTEVCTMVMVQSYRGGGPVEGSLAQVEIPWHALTETTVSP